MTQTVSMTYGTLPTREQWDVAFERECPTGKYRIQLGRSGSRACDGFKLGDGEWTADQLWEAVSEIVNAGPDEITLDMDDTQEWGTGEPIYQVFFPDEHLTFYRELYQFHDACLEIGSTEEDLIGWAEKFCDHAVTHVEMSKEALNFAQAYRTEGKEWARKDAALDLVSGIVGTLGFEWI